jgi:hypothetical protein
MGLDLGLLALLLSVLLQAGQPFLHSRGSFIARKPSHSHCLLSKHTTFLQMHRSPSPIHKEEHKKSANTPFPSKQRSDKSKMQNTLDSSTTISTLDVDINMAQKQIENIVNTTLDRSIKARLVDFKWVQSRCEVVVDVRQNDDPEAGLSIQDLNDLHSAVYMQLEADPMLNAYLARIEILFATPGVSDVLRIDRDFRSFQV